MQVFLAAPFLDPAILGRIFVEPGETRPASLADHALHADSGRLRIGLVPEAGASASGALVEAGAGVAARVAFLMEALGASVSRVTVATADGEGPAEAHLLAVGEGAQEMPDPGFLREIVEEVLGHFGRTEASRMPALMHGIGFRALARLRGRAREAPAVLGSKFGAADVEVLELEYAYADYFGVEARRLRHRRFDGGWSDPVNRAVLTSGDAVTVLPFDPRRDSVLLIEQFRPGAHARRDPRPWFLEAVAGRCDGLEPPEETARREALEEAGLTLGRLERIAGYYTTPGIAAEFITAYVGEADLSAAGGLHGLATENEDIRALVVPLGEAFAAADRGEAANAPLLLSLFWLQQHHTRLAADWT